MAKTSPTQRALKDLREQGYTVAIVEKYNAFAGPVVNGKRVGIRQDLFGFADIISLGPGKRIVAIQSCGQNFAEHERTMLDSEATANVIEWLRAGGEAELWGWRKLKLARGGKAERWTPRARAFTLADFGVGDRREQEQG